MQILYGHCRASQESIKGADDADGGCFGNDHFDTSDAAGERRPPHHRNLNYASHSWGAVQYCHRNRSSKHRLLHIGSVYHILLWCSASY